MTNSLPVAPHGTTEQMSPDHAAVPFAGGPLVDCEAPDGDSRRSAGCAGEVPAWTPLMGLGLPTRRSQTGGPQEVAHG